MSDELYATPLVWGHGERLFEVFLEPTCPFSVKALKKLDAFLALAGEDQVKVRIWLQSQPWHMYSGVICRAILAASTLENGRDQARKLMDAVADHREEFEFDQHATGPNRQATPDDIIARMKSYSGVDFVKAFDEPRLQQVIKLHVKYGRQNGIHVSPTFMVDGIVDPALGSGDDVSVWAERFA